MAASTVQVMGGKMRAQQSQPKELDVPTIRTMIVKVMSKPKRAQQCQPKELDVATTTTTGAQVVDIVK